MQQRNYPKIFGLIGGGLGLTYMLYTVLAPRGGTPVPWQHNIWTLLALSPFFAVFGALVGTGIGFLIAALLKKH